MCFTNSICRPPIFYFLVSLSLTASFQNSLKTHKIAQNCVQNDQKLSAGVEAVGGKKGGVRRENWGGRAPWLLAGIDAPENRPKFCMFLAPEFFWGSAPLIFGLALSNTRRFRSGGKV